MSKPLDLSDKRQHAEAVAYGRLIAVREILDALAEDRPAPRHTHGGTIIGGWHDCWRSDYRRGYERAVRVVKAIRLGVEK